MKKNVVAHMTAPKEPFKKRFRKLNLIPKFICLLLALILWLFVIEIQKNAVDEPNGQNTQTTSDSVVE